MALVQTNRKPNVKRAAFVGVVFVVGGAFLTASPARAQSGPSTASFGHAVLRHFDVFAGNDKVGPFVLSWNRLRISREDRLTVVVDGTTLSSDAYTIDTIKGTITFRQPLAAASLARVSYSYDPKIAQRNDNPASAPVTVPLLQMGGLGALRMTALPNANSKTGDAEGPGTPMLWSLGGKQSLLGGGLESLVNYAGPGGTAMKMAYKWGSDKNGIAANFDRTERAFAERVGQRMNLTEPTQKQSLAARFAPAKWVQTGYTSLQIRDLKTRSTKDTDTYALNLGGGAAPLLNFTHVLDDSNTADKKQTTVETDKLELGATIGKALLFAATGQRGATDAPDTASDSKTEDATLSLTAQSANKTQQAVVSVSSNARETEVKDEGKRNVALKLQPGSAFILSAEQKAQTVTPIQDGKTQPSTNTMVQTAVAEITPAPRVKITGAVTQTTTETPAPAAPTTPATDAASPAPTPTSVTVSSTDVSAKVGEGKAIEVAAGVTNRSTDAPGQTALDTTRAQIALRPTGGLTLTGGYTWNPENRDQGTVNQALRQEFGLKAKLGGLELGSGYALTTLNGLTGEVQEAQFGEVSVTLGMRFDKQTVLSGTYKDSLRWRDAAVLPASQVPQYLKAYNLDFKRDLGSDLNVALGGSYTLNRALARDPKEIKAEARIGVRF